VEAERRADESLDHHSPLEELFEDQLRAADLVVLSKTDGVAPSSLDAVKDEVAREVREGVPVVAAATRQVFGLAAAAEADLAARDGHHSHADADHEHDDFDSRIVDARFPTKAAAEEAVAALAANPAILRVKGSVAVADKPAPLFVQAVGPRMETWFGRPGTAATGLVVIGLSPLDTAALEGLGTPQAA
jgi:cobalamin biosynthesis protein CobW